MNIATLIAGILLGVLALVSPAHAGKDVDRTADRPSPPEERRSSDRSEARDGRRGEDADARRLSPDERRELRRDIRDAGREIYERDRRRGRDGS